MNFKFSQDQEMMRDSAKRLLADLSSYAAVHKILDSEATHDANLWKQMAEAGWLSTAIPEEYGGAGMGYLELAVLAEEMGKTLACTPFSSSIYMAAELIKAAGSESQKATYLAKLAAGDAIATVGNSGGNADSGLYFELRHQGKPLDPLTWVNIR